MSTDPNLTRPNVNASWSCDTERSGTLGYLPLVLLLPDRTWSRRRRDGRGHRQHETDNRGVRGPRLRQTWDRQRQGESWSQTETDDRGHTMTMSQTERVTDDMGRTRTVSQIESYG